MSGGTQKVTVLGSTGSIGVNTLDVIRHSDQFEVFALTANSNVEVLYTQCLEFEPDFAVMVDEAAAKQLAERLSHHKTEVLAGTEDLRLIAADLRSQITMAAVVGAAGLEPTLAAASAGKKILLANKESLVMAGELFMDCVRESGAKLLPIDSEHNAIFQCLPDSSRNHATRVGLSGVKRVILTASGGPFLDMDSNDFERVTPQQACKHPRWDMGRKISVDSATLMNKGLEYIEACYLFGLDNSMLEVLVHPQSIVHSMVEYLDGSILAQLANPDMRIPIAYGLAWPERMNSGANLLDLASGPDLQFRNPDMNRFPCLQLGMEAARQRGTAPAILNAANEVAVEAFLNGCISFPDIHRVIDTVMSKIPCESAQSLDIIQRVDSRARSLAKEMIDQTVR